MIDSFVTSNRGQGEALRRNKKLNTKKTRAKWNTKKNQLGIQPIHIYLDNQEKNSKKTNVGGEGFAAGI